MKSVFSSVARTFTQAWVWSLLLVLAIALAVWFGGPLVAVAGEHFWESATSRLMTLCIVLLCWGLILLLAERRKGHSEPETETDQDTTPALAYAMKEQRTALRKRFKDAVLTLQRSSLYQGHDQRWRKQLPWYLLIGPERSGKTSLLDHSGIKFPLNQIDGQRNSPPAATEHCDWYFAEEGVLLDTSGRFLAAKNPCDIQSWRTLLKLLRSRRRSQPLNGVIVSLPIELLLDVNPEPLKQVAGQIRSRLLDIQRQLHSRVPVYLVLTKADAVAGFEAFFGQLSQEENQQVLGVSFKESQQGTDPAVLHEAFEDLLRRLNSQVVMRLQQERSIERRGRILDFPHRLGLIGTQLAMLVETALRGNRYEPDSLLRGVYLTSAPY